MTISKFEYIAPKTVEEAVQILNENSKKYTFIMAGGTDLLVKVRHSFINPKLIVGLKKIDNLNLISFDHKKGLTIGATALLSEVSDNKDIIKYYPTVAKAAKSTANTQIRNMGTVIGNLCNASPSADNAPILLSMQAIVNIVGKHGNRNIPLDNFFVGPGLTALTHEEIVTSVFVPKPPKNTGTSYEYFSQRSQIDCSAVGVGTMLTVENKKISDIRIFVGACGPIPTRAIKAEHILKNKKIDSQLIRKASSLASKEMSPISDIRASAQYRKKIISIVSEKAINNALYMAHKKN